MGFDITTSIKDDFVLLRATGEINDFEEFKLINKLYIENIEKLKIDRIIVDETDLKKPLSVLNMLDLNEFYATRIPHYNTRWKVAVIVNTEYQELAKLWEMLANKNGYEFKIFLSMEEALQFIK